MSNRLADATSPYLQQHAQQPVDWWPWCEEALETARRERKPILLSIGYSACHWCHVMAHESFDDPEVAERMNRLFVNIKVDREERPDLDKIYQNAHYLLTRRSGGWPLTVFLDPEDQVPFYAGTYFPPRPRHGLPGFADLIEGVARAWREQQAAIGEQSRALVEALEALEGDDRPAQGALELFPFHNGVRALVGQFDRRHGGFGSAPKFPHPDSLALLLRSPQREAACFTLERMARGGIQDQLGGGFARYSVDERWEIPHFEKMLYDNGLLLALYAEAERVTGDPLFRRTCEATAHWLLEEMHAPEGGFHSSLDADSEGEEGRFYLWTPDQMRSGLDPDQWAVAAPHWGLDGPPNFEGRWHLVVKQTPDAIARKRQLPTEEVERRLEAARERLRQARDQRVPPARDDKILTGWNALVIRGLARAGRLLRQPRWIEAAEQAADFLHRTLWRDGRLLAVHKAGVSRLDAYLEDHAWLLQALLELLQCRWDDRLLEWARQLAGLMLDHFEDRDHGGFYMTADDHESLLQRPRVFTDDATPSGNGIAAQALLELSGLTGEPRWQAAAERTLRAAWSGLLRSPHAHPSLLLALHQLLQPGDRIVLRGTPEAMAPWQAAAGESFDPWRTLYAVPCGAESLPPALAAHCSSTPVAAWICRGTRCLPPVTTLDAFRARLEKDEPDASGARDAGV